MNKARWKRLVGVPVLAALFSVGAAYAQSLAKGDQKILTDMAMANMAEVEVGKLAVQKSQNTEVKSFAQQMVDDHGKGLEEVKKVAGSKNVTLPAELDSKHKAMLSKLQGMSGDQFDRAYMEQAGVKAHSDALALVTKAQSGAKDSDVQALASKLQPTIQQHKGHADQLNASIKGSTAMGNSGTQGTSGSSVSMKDRPDRKAQPASGNTDSPASPANPTTQPPAPIK
jgi:putative membrane protein